MPTPFSCCNSVRKHTWPGGMAPSSLAWGRTGPTISRTLSERLISVRLPTFWMFPLAIVFAAIVATYDVCELFPGDKLSADKGLLVTKFGETWLRHKKRMKKKEYRSHHIRKWMEQCLVRMFIFVLVTFDLLCKFGKRRSNKKENTWEMNSLKAITISRMRSFLVLKSKLVPDHADIKRNLQSDRLARRSSEDIPSFRGKMQRCLGFKWRLLRFRDLICQRCFI